MATALGVRVTELNTQQSFDRVFPRFPVRIGRNALCELRLDYPFVSQFHAVIDFRDNQLLLRDLGSTNGTLIRSGRLSPNQEVNLGEHGYEFRIVMLHFTTYSAAAPVTTNSPRRPLGVTGYLSSMALAEARAVAERPAAVVSARQKTAFEAYRRSWATVLQELRDGLNALPPPSRASFLSDVAKAMPGIGQEPEFRALSGEHGLATDVSGQRPEDIALQGLTELAADYAPDSVRPNTAEDWARFLTKLSDTLDMFLRCFIPLRDGYRQFEADMALRAPGGRPTQAVETAKDPKELGLRLLDWRDPSHEAPQAVESIFADLMVHQVAMLNGVMNGVKSILKELSPAEMERTAEDDPRHRATALLGRHKALWKFYEQRYADLAEDEKQLFSQLFGREFGQAYRKLHGDDRSAVYVSQQQRPPTFPPAGAAVVPQAPGQPGPVPGGGPTRR